MEFKVPQFIDVEDKIAGPLTFFQLVYLAGGAGLTYILWTLLPRIIAFPLVMGVLALSLLLTFYPKDRYGKTFVAIMESAFQFYFVRPKLYTWKKIPKTPKKKAEEKEKVISVTVPNISESNLKNMSWGLDVKKEM